MSLRFSWDFYEVENDNTDFIGVGLVYRLD